MTTAVCFNCGSFKLGAFTACPKCRAVPEKQEDLSLSIAMSSHFYSEADLKRMGQMILEGKQPEITPSIQGLLRSGSAKSEGVMRAMNEKAKKKGLDIGGLGKN